jgi:hypothetical protein
MRMEWLMEETLVIIAMFLLRIGVPLVFTLALGYLLRRLDTRWEADALAERAGEEVPVELKALKTTEQPCWEIKGCSEEQRATCPACEFWDLPCWVARLRATGRLPTECHNCGLFSPSPVG